MSKVTFSCKVCGKQVTDYPYNKKTYCSSNCRFIDWNGKNNPNYGHKWSPEKKTQSSQRMRGHIPWNKGLTKKDPRVLKYSRHMIGNKYCLGKRPSQLSIEKLILRNSTDNVSKRKEVKEKLSRILKEKYKNGSLKPWNKGICAWYVAGSNNYNWKGDNYDRTGYRAPNWKSEITKNILKRDNYKCVKCGFSDKENLKKFGWHLSVHHIISFVISKNNNSENLITLCISCHMKEHAILTKNGGECNEHNQENGS